MPSVASTFHLETHCRRRNWQGGQPIRLADGADWYLPAIDEDLKANDPSIITVLLEADALARGPKTPGATAQDELDCLCQTHGVLAVVAVKAFRANYNLPDCTWESLLIGNTLLDTFQMTLSLAFALDEDRRRSQPCLSGSHLKPGPCVAPSKPVGRPAIP